MTFGIPPISTPQRQNLLWALGAVKTSVLYRHWRCNVSPEQQMDLDIFRRWPVPEFPSLWFDVDDVEGELLPLQGYLDFGRLAKLMSQTTSSFDGEALTSVRMANELVRNAGTTWAEVLLRVIREQLKEEEKPPTENLSAQDVLLQTLRFLRDTRKISEAVYERMFKLVVMVLRSSDNRFHRRAYRRIREILWGAKDAPVGSRTAP